MAFFYAHTYIKKTNKNNYNIKSSFKSVGLREEVMDRGIRHLSDVELIALILGSGGKEKNVFELSNDLIKEVNGDLEELSSWEYDDYCNIYGIGKARAAQLMSVFELGRRKGSDQANESVQILDSYSAYRLIKPKLQDLKREEFWVAFCNNANKLIRIERFSTGGLGSTVVDVRLILRKALGLWSSALVLFHNHPSGNLMPSKEDEQITCKIKKALSSMEIRLLDHLIVGNNAYYSFADESVL